MAVELATRAGDERGWQVSNLTSLDLCPAGARARIEAVATEDADGCRLRELGMYEGAEIQVISLGDPVVVSIFGNRFAVCRRCARFVSVQRLD